MKIEIETINISSQFSRNQSYKLSRKCFMQFTSYRIKSCKDYNILMSESTKTIHQTMNSILNSIGIEDKKTDYVVQMLGLRKSDIIESMDNEDIKALKNRKESTLTLWDYKLSINLRYGVAGIKSWTKKNYQWFGPLSSMKTPSMTLTQMYLQSEG